MRRFSLLILVSPLILLSDRLSTYQMPLSPLHADIRSLLGTTQHFSASKSKELTRLIKPYVDSQDVIKTKKPKKKPAKRRKTDEGAASTSTSTSDVNAENEDRRALWPIVSGLAMRCNAEALASGAVLVDLPGVGDANAARECVAKEYGKADFWWFAAPITRAVSDKLAKGKFILLRP